LWTLWRQVGFFYIVLLTLHCPNLQPIHKSTNTCQSSLHTCSPNLLWTNEYHHRSPIGLCQQLIMVRFRVGAAIHIQTQLVQKSAQSYQLLFSSHCVYVTLTEFILFLCPLDLEGRWPQLSSFLHEKCSRSNLKTLRPYFVVVIQDVKNMINIPYQLNFSCNSPFDHCRELPTSGTLPDTPLGIGHTVYLTLISNRTSAACLIVRMGWNRLANSILTQCTLPHMTSQTTSLLAFPYPAPTKWAFVPWTYSSNQSNKPS